jgi:hypothetical protein
MMSLYIQDGKARRLAKECVCLECNKKWLIRSDRENSGYCRDCLTKGIRNPMYGKTGWNKNNNTYNRYEYARNRKREIVSMFGNRCAICRTENLPISNYEFHHLNPKEKQYQISKILLWNWDIIKNELQKCIMICANCHKTLTFGDEQLNKS